MTIKELLAAQDELRAVEEELCKLDVDISSAYLGDVGLGCCLDCAHFREEHGRGGDGTLLWGVCRRDGRHLCELPQRAYGRGRWS